MIRLLVLSTILALVGCNGQTGPPSVSEKSTARPLLSDRVEMLEKYVKFRREYVQLEYEIVFQNNGVGLAPGPSDWDIRLVAKVPVGELDDWIDQGMTADVAPAKAWHLETGTEIDATNVVEWYSDGQRSVGIDRTGSVVAYRNSTLGQ